ncbi:hypothetical protein BT96DRAFT_1024444 [Gymnopus androsaceus JB14]|uniref:Uncharacterized protein n=1 Tax=Gymnopus androsaceus JB14 TaxID=1447944 RepID=A0A6A4GZX1_9AGAR|nr:hypothetical protein BT96DRAFT_1024444 [Gymnopus androsaceus JB14]
MTPEESEQLAALGAVCYMNISAQIFTIGLLGVYILAFIISMHTIMQKANNGWAHKAFIALLLAEFVLVILYTGTGIAVNFFFVETALVVSLPAGLIAQEVAASLETNAMTILQEWSGNFILLIADMAFVWRAWALWTENRLIKWTLFIILLTDIGVTIADTIAVTKVFFNIDSHTTVTFDWLSGALNLTVNIVATLLIAHRAWTNHQSNRVILHNRKTQVQAILLLMIESGAIFGAVQVTDIIFDALDIQAATSSPVNNARLFSAALYLFSAVLNPVALVILIQTGNTYEQSSDLGSVPLDINSTPHSN